MDQSQFLAAHKCCSVAWAAGLFEGEGSILWSRGPRLVIYNNDRDVLEMFEEVIGGGEIYGPYGPYRGQMGSNPRYYWAIRGHEAVDRVFTMLQPWLSDRRMSQGVQVLARG